MVYNSVMNNIETLKVKQFVPTGLTYDEDKKWKMKLAMKIAKHLLDNDLIDIKNHYEPIEYMIGSVDVVNHKIKLGVVNWDLSGNGGQLGISTNTGPGITLTNETVRSAVATLKSKF